MSHDLIIHVVTSPTQLNWSNPRSLLLSTFYNHLLGDKAPIGHFYVEFPLIEGVFKEFHPKIGSVIQGGKRVLTGMSRQKMTVLESLKTVQGKRLGLGTFYYDFKGKLDSVNEAIEEIAWAKRKNRYSSLSISVSEEKIREMISFLHQWIERGSFRHYSGGLKVDCGEGAGCAEFAMHFLSMALGVHAVSPDWVQRVRIPHSLIGGGFAGHSQKISVTRLFLEGHRWAYGNEPHHVYSIPDPELFFQWLKNHPTRRLIAGEVNWSSGAFESKEFTVDYPKESLGSIQEQWMKVVDFANS